jgi:hypothetical protein
MDIYSAKHTAIDRTPYTYALTHLPSERRYYGVKWATGCHPSTFWIDYKTSSGYIKELIDQDGLHAFTYEIRKVFDDPKKARDWEKKVIKRLGVPKNPHWINKKIPGKRFHSTPESLAKLRGRPKSEEHKAKISASNVGKHDHWNGKKHSEESKIKIAMSLKGKTRKPLSEEHKLKLSALKKGKPKSEEHKRKISEALKKGR